MTIYLKITVAMLISAALIETNGFIGKHGYGEFIMAFVYAGMLLAGAFFFVTAAEKYAHRQSARIFPKTRRATRKGQALELRTQPLGSVMKIAVWK